MKILALDVATKTGWFMGIAGGVWNFAPKRDESKGMKLIRFRAKLQEIHKSEGIDLVVFEQTAGRFKNALIAQAELHGAMKLWCEENKIEYRSYPAASIKKFATGKGNAKKPEMIQAAKEKYGIEPIDDNHADAIHIYYLTKSDMQL